MDGRLGWLIGGATPDGRCNLGRCRWTVASSFGTWHCRSWPHCVCSNQGPSLLSPDWRPSREVGTRCRYLQYDQVQVPGTGTYRSSLFPARALRPCRLFTARRAAAVSSLNLTTTAWRISVFFPITISVLSRCFSLFLCLFPFSFLSSLPHRHHRHSSPFRLSQPPICTPRVSRLQLNCRAPFSLPSRPSPSPNITTLFWTPSISALFRSLAPRERLVADIVTSDSPSSAFAFASPSALALSRSP